VLVSVVLILFLIAVRFIHVHAQTLLHDHSVATLDGKGFLVRNKDTNTGKTMVAIVFRGTRPVYLQVILSTILYQLYTVLYLC
jgi:membrane protein required for beta-lactamase induction